MRKMRKMLAVTLCVLLAVGLFAGCGGNNQEKMEALAGTWEMVLESSPEQTQLLMENIELYEEEIALVQNTVLKEVYIVEFNTEGNYRQAYDPEGIREYVRSFYVGVFEELYQGRTMLNDVYGMAFGKMSQEEFQQFYADLYGAANFEELMDLFADAIYDYESLGDLESGTYTIVGDSLHLSVGEGSGTVGYEIDGDTLTLTYSDGVEVYTRVP